MSERPIIFGADSVRAILAGRKTQTRRVVKPVRGFEHNNVCRPDMAADPWVVWWHGESERVGCLQECPYGVPGDRLWVRESYKTGEYLCTDEQQGDDHECDEHCKQTYVYYAATPRRGYRPVPDRASITYLHESSPLTEFYSSGWKTPIFMPRWASRLTLEITDVRVQRLQSISDEDARAEGQGMTWGSGCFHRSFAGAWDSLNAKRGHGWNTNPWVWAVTFRSLR